MIAADSIEVPIQGYVKIPAERANSWLPLLREIYRFESDRISGPGSEKRLIENVIWSKEDLLEQNPTASIHHEALEDLLKFLEDGRQIMKFPAHGEILDRYITRVGELARMLGHTYEYWHRGRPGVSAVRWLVVDKMVPKLSIPAPLFRDQIVEKLKE